MAGRVHRRRRPGVRGADPPDRRRAPRRARRGCSTSAPVRARSPGAPRAGRRRVVGVDPTANQLAAAPPTGRRRRVRARRRPTPCPFADAIVRRGRRVPRVRAPRPSSRARGGRPGARARRPLPAAPEPPAAAGAGQRLDRRPHPRGAVLAGRALPRSTTSSVEELAPGVVLPFVHRPLGRYVQVMGASGC